MLHIAHIFYYIQNISNEYLKTNVDDLEWRDVQHLEMISQKKSKVKLIKN